MNKLFCIISLVFFSFIIANAQRNIISLNGTWDIDESNKPNDIPRKYLHTVQVPGLVKSSSPTFPDVDQFESRQYLINQQYFLNKKYIGFLIDTLKTGITRQHRNYFWYHKTFNPGEHKNVAILKINKAQFGTAVWLNGHKIGEHMACFHSISLDVSKFIHWQSNNELIIRVGAHPAAVPSSFPTGTDPEKVSWTPGIYDDIALIACDNPFVQSIQIAPDINTSRIRIELKLKNYSNNKKVVSIMNTVRPWKSSDVTARGLPQTFLMEPNETKTIFEEIRIDNVKLWSPSDPNLYVLETSTGGDFVTTRFGMREFHFDTKTNRAYLNNKIFFMRGSNITLHRFFEDSLCGMLPWTDAWVKKLLVDIPKKMSWNTFRFCIGPVPDKWLDLCDEAGLLIQNEFPIWRYNKWWNKEEVRKQMKAWVTDNCNHPSIVIWDACNETKSEELTELLPDVRKTDLSNRPWENGYSLPDDENDPVNDHHYFFYFKNRFFENDSRYDWNVTKFENWVGEKSTNSAHPTSHAVILNEYGWLWLHRDGSVNGLTKPAFDNIAPNANNDERIEKAAYLFGLETEYFRAHRNYAAVMHFNFLTCDHLGEDKIIAQDLFKDVQKLELHPAYEKYFIEAFKPLGVYLNFTRDTLMLQEKYTFDVMMVNDEYKTMFGNIEVSISNPNGILLTKLSKPFSLSELSSHTYQLKLNLPKETGKYILKAIAYTDNNSKTTTSIRTLTLYKP